VTNAARERADATFVAWASPHDLAIWDEHPWVSAVEREQSSEDGDKLWFWLVEVVDAERDAAEEREQRLARNPMAPNAHVDLSGYETDDTFHPVPSGFLGAHPSARGVATIVSGDWWLARLWLPPTQLEA
jgi:hypothetical protein